MGVHEKAAISRMNPKADTALAVVLGARLIDSSESLVEKWRGSHGSVLPGRALVNDIPVMIRTIGRFVQNPQVAVREEIVARWRANGAAAQPDPDCSVGEMLMWLDGLSKLIVRHMEDDVSGADDARLATGAFARIFEGLRDMTSAILELYAEDPRWKARHGSRPNTVLAHEMRNALQTISMCTSLLEIQSHPPATEQHKRQFIIIRGALAQADWLLECGDLLTRTGNGEFHARIAPVGCVLESVSQGLEARAMAADVDLRVSVGAPALAVEAGVAHLILSNLIINAIKYCDHAKFERRVTVRAAKTAGDRADFVVIEVADNGIGIPANMQQRVFEPSCRAHPQVADGLGIGLSIVRDLLDSRGGSVELISQERVGTTVRCTLPASPLGAV